ncbi:MAG: DUF192 domain-containing protein [Spirochaetia bacterium]|nr:DUF192 domain-containing protein [Spirochaetia bacterium]
MFNRRILFISLIFCIFALGASCRNSNLEKKTLTLCKADGTELSVKAELAVKPEDRNFGFMERKNIPDGTGMLFVFEYDQILSFWMKNTPTPLSIAFITKDGKIKDIFDMQPFSTASKTSTGYVRYALEVPQGWYKKNGIKTGDVLKIDF